MKKNKPINYYEKMAERLIDLLTKGEIAIIMLSGIFGGLMSAIITKIFIDKPITISNVLFHSWEIIFIACIIFILLFVVMAILITIALLFSDFILKKI